MATNKATHTTDENKTPDDSTTSTVEEAPEMEEVEETSPSGFTYTVQRLKNKARTPENK